MILFWASVVAGLGGHGPALATRLLRLGMETCTGTLQRLFWMMGAGRSRSTGLEILETKG